MDAMTKMWVSFGAIGLMVLAAFIISFARYKTKGPLKFVLSFIAYVILLIAALCGLISII